MPIKAVKVLGSVSLLVGVLFLINASASITGFAIAEGIGASASSVLGIAFIVLGIALLSYRESASYETRESRLHQLIGERRYEKLSEKDKVVYNKSYRRHLEAEERREHQGQREPAHESTEVRPHVIRTEHFERAIRGHDEAAIVRAINKIGTGLGKEEKLKHLPEYSIRVSKGGRIIFNKGGDGTIELRDYLSSHAYTKYQKNR